MSFQNYEGFQNQAGQQDAGGAAAGPPTQQDASMGGQMPDNGAQFQGGNGGDPGSAGGQQPGSDAKTTLWYDLSPSSSSQGCYCRCHPHHALICRTFALLWFSCSEPQDCGGRCELTSVSGWVSLNHGLTRTSSEVSGTTWVNR